MRRIEQARWILVLLAIAVAGAGAQQAPAAPGSTPQATAPTPDAEGVYHLEPGIVSPRIVEAAQATPPANVQSDHLLMVRLSAVIEADGSVQDVMAFGSRLDALEDPAVAAVKQSKFAAGTLNGAAVPVRVCVQVPFFGIAASVPRLWPCPSGGMMARAGIRPPRILYAPVPEYSDQARRKKIQGVVIVSTLVDEQGVPTDIRVEKSLGYGLDERAVECAGQYRFRPAVTRDGKPVAQRITIEMNFRLY